MNTKSTINSTFIKKVSLAVFFFFSLIPYNFSQESEPLIDSLKAELKRIGELPKSETNDTLQIKILEELVEFIYEDEVWGKYNKEVIQLAKKLLKSDDKKVQRKAYLSYALALNNDGLYENNKGNNIVAKQLYFKSLEILEKLDEKLHTASTLNNIGYVYKTDGDLVKALEYYLKSLKIREEINDEPGIALSLNNIGLIYNAQGNKKLAKEYFIKCITILEKHGDKYQLSSTLNNLAIIYAGERYFNKAIELYARSKVLQQNIGDKSGVAYTYVNMGTVYQSLGRNDEALSFYKQGLAVFQELNSIDGLAWAYLNIGNVYFSSNKYQLSKLFLDSSVYYATKLNQPELLERAERFYYQLDSAQGNFAEAFEHHKKYIFYRDSITNSESQKRNIQQQLYFEFDKKEAVLKEQQLKDKLVSEEKSRKQRLIIWVVIIVLALVFFFTLFILRTLSLTRKQKNIIEKQKELVEAKQKEILDSIRYAKRIQDALLTSQTYIERNLKRLRND